ncbi:MAG TPA: glycosyltransferase family 2 protein [Candidatus Dormibacteraeota bacterium]|nr:glycosyltransferase family 2 protein [Candidatus Dormibacteraeota bacterium]
MIWIFWLAAALLLYTFAGYPVLLLLLARWRKRVHMRAPIEPLVSIIIAAHNEESLIGKKMENCLELDYPKDRREIIVASDGSTDSTVRVAGSFADQGVRVIDLAERGGKQNAQLQAIKAARSEILVFTDPGTQLPRNALREMVSNFADPAVGCVSSEDQLIQESRGWIGERSYVRLEMWMRRQESLLGSLVTASGSFFAARRSVCETWPVDQTSDFFVPLNAIALGMRAVVDPASVGRYAASRTETAELRRKVRTVVIGLYVFFSHGSLLNPLRHALTAWQLVSHKLCRWLTPFAALALLVSSLSLWHAAVFYRLCAVLLIAAIAAGILGLAAGRLTQWKPLRLAGYLLLGNAATVMAWSYYIMGERFVTWQPTRRS